MTSDSRQRLLVAAGLLSLGTLAGATALAMGGLVSGSLAAWVSLTAAAVGLVAGLAVRGRGWTIALVVPNLTYLLVILTS